MNNIVGWQKYLTLYLDIVNLVLKYFVIINFNSVSECVGQACWYADRLHPSPRPPATPPKCLPKVIYF